jgi:uncharacterized protein YndB with AHSA1/START domain
MIDPADLATLTRQDGRIRARFEREFGHDRKTLWAALTEPAKLAEWLAPGEIELREGGAAKLNFTDSGTVIDSIVAAFDPGYLIEYSWSSPGEPQRPVRWELDSTDAGTRVFLTLLIPEGEDAGRACAGWEAHLDMLAAALEGVPIKFPFEHFKAARDAYKALLA